MALRHCPECGTSVSTTALSCPKCGYQLKRLGGFSRFSLFFVIVAAIVFAAVLLHCGE